MAAIAAMPVAVPRPAYPRRGGRGQREDAMSLRTRLLGPDEPEVTCEQCFELLDQYVDLEAARADADARLPGMRGHLQGCPACREDHDSLLALVSAAHADRG
jgi:hypothetical protein